jgi:hypothetical protein
LAAFGEKGSAMNRGSTMGNFTHRDHRVEKIDVRVTVANMTMAQALRPKLEALASEIFPGVLEEVFDGVAIDDLVLELEALDLDLGTVRADTLETDAVAALRALLPGAVAAAVVEARQGIRADARLLTIPAGRLARLESFLVSGVLPFSARGERFDLAEEVRYLAIEQSTALVAMARTHVQNRRFLERLVLQADTRGLIQWLRLLAPADAIIILALLLDIQRIHRRVPIAPMGRLSTGELRQMLWVTTLEFLLRDAGSNFNRRRFLAALIGREAVRLGLSLDALLELFAEAVEIAGARTPLRSSLPGTLWALLAERRGRGSANATSVWAGGGSGTAQPSAGQPPSWPSGGATVLEQWVGALHRTAFARLLERIVPHVAGQLASELDLVEQLHRDTALLPISASALVRKIRAVMLECLVDESAQRLDARACWRLVLHALARQSAINPDTLIERVESQLFRPICHAGGTPPLPDRVTKIRAGAGPVLVDMTSRLLAILLAGATGEIALAAAGGEGGRAFESLLQKLAPGDEALLLDGVDVLMALQAESPLVGMAAPAFRAFVQAALLDALMASKGRPGRRMATVWKTVVARLAEATGQPRGAMAGWLRALRHARRDHAPSGASSTREEQRRLIAAYLWSGSPQSAGADLPDLAARDPAWLRSQLLDPALRRFRRADALAERLLDWLMPGELVALFRPPDADALLRAAPPSGGDEWRFWYVWLVAQLRGERPLLPDETKGVSVHRLDRIFALGTALDSLASADGTVAALASPQDLRDLNAAELTSLFLAEDETETFARLVAATEAMSSAAADALLARLSSWAARSEAVMAALDAMPDAVVRRTILLRSAAAGLAGCAVDVARLAEPIPLIARAPRERPIVRAGAGAEVGVEAAAVEGATATIDAAQLFEWLDGAAVSAADADALVTLFSQLADSNDAELIAYLKARRTLGRARLRWVTILPMPALGRLIHLLVPAEAPSLVNGVLLLATAWRQTATFGSPRRTPEDLWKLLLDRIAEPRVLSVPKLLSALMSDLAGKDTDRLEKVRQRTGKLASDGGYATLAAALRRNVPTPPKRLGAVAQTASDALSPEEPNHALYVGNAGLVLLNPFLPTLFERLDLLTVVENDRPTIAPGSTASRAVHLLQYLADGRLDRPEPELVLNKLLCGLPTAEPVARSVTPALSDLKICDDLLCAVIANWPRLDRMTPDALQETFLLREGRLQRGEGKWLLHVQRKTLDVLTDQLPWAFSVVYHRWMADPIHVTW